jgi:hypothetical protein
MIAALLLATLSASPVAGADILAAVEDRSFYVAGWYCDDAGCRSNPRRLGPSVRFQLQGAARILKRADHLAADWSVILNCRVVRGRLRKCHIADDTAAPPKGVDTALNIAAAMRVAPLVPSGTPGSAIIDINYEAGSCPSWQCVPTPAPPPPPPPQQY